MRPLQPPHNAPTADPQAASGTTRSGTPDDRAAEGTVRVRLVGHADAPAVADLCTQLGYPASGVGVARRLDMLAGADDHAVYVAAAPDGGVVGWVHAHAPRLLVEDAVAEVLGLVVDERRRGGGIGRLLLAEAERWALARGCREMCVRSNVVRDGAHAFYGRQGYAVVKRSVTFRKVLHRDARGSA